MLINSPPKLVQFGHVWLKTIKTFPSTLICSKFQLLPFHLPLRNHSFTGLTSDLFSCRARSSHSRLCCLQRNMPATGKTIYSTFCSFQRCHGRCVKMFCVIFSVCFTTGPFDSQILKALIKTFHNNNPER